MKTDRCKTCNSPAPHLHPAVQAGGEVHLCKDAFHQKETPENMRFLRIPEPRPAAIGESCE